MSADTKSVDVLAVLDDHCKYCDLRMTDRHGIGPALIEARAAVAELIEASRQFDKTYVWHWDRVDGAAVIMPDRVPEFEARAARLSAALAACGGAK